MRPPLATTVPHLRRDLSFTSADEFGLDVAHHELIRAALEFGAASAVHIFAEVITPPSNPSVDGPYRLDPALQELRDRFGRSRIELFGLLDLPALASKSEYVIQVPGPQLSHLAQARRSLSSDSFAVCSILHAATWPDLLGNYLGALLSTESYDALVVTSEAGKLAVIKSMETAIDFVVSKWGVPEDHMRSNSFRIEKIPLGVDTREFSKHNQLSYRRLLGLHPSDLVILYLGRLSRRYKADLAPLLSVCSQLFQEVPSGLLLIAGQDTDGSYSSSLEQQARSLGIAARVRVIRNFPPFLKPMIYAASDVFVSPVDNIQETFGLSILEAMASGLPVVASDWSGYRDLVIHDETGFLASTVWNDEAGELVGWLSPVSARTNPEYFLAQRTIIDYGEIYHFLKVLAASPDLRSQFGAAGKRRVEAEFSWRHVISRFDELWSDQRAILSQHRARETVRPKFNYNRLFGHYATSSDLKGRPFRATKIGLMFRDEIKAGRFNVPAVLASYIMEVINVSAQNSTTELDLPGENEFLKHEAITFALKNGWCHFEQPERIAM